jgi:hypothetical protein
MVDRREEILNRLEVILPAVPGVVSFFRNEVKAPEGKLPAVILLDGDEMADEAAFGRGRPANAITVMTMMPEIYIIVMEGDDLGTRLNELRTRVKHAILNDAQLLALAKDGDVRYEGMQTALALGRSMAGEAGLNFSIAYKDTNPTGN